MRSSKPDLSLPGEMAIGPTSPIQRALRLLHDFFGAQPAPDLAGDAPKRSAMLAANHLLELIEACGLLNGSGMHSAAVVLLRSLEDAFDVFIAVSTVQGAAERWEKHDLRPSEAAKLWVEHRGNSEVQWGENRGRLADYRKGLRNAFNKYSHASYDLCLWDLYFSPHLTASDDQPLTGTLEINYPRRVINSNAHAIDAHLTAHILEFLDAMKAAYSRALREFRGRDAMVHTEAEIHAIMQKHNAHGCQNVQAPAELRRLR